jgi:hypothetical protein
MTLEQELHDVLRAARLDAKQGRAVARRLGWDGRPPTTLAAAGASEGYTRERVRQLEQRVLRHVQRVEPRFPMAEAALAVIHAAAPASRAQLANTLVSARLAEQPFDPLGVLRAGEVAGLEVAVVERDGLVLRNDHALATNGASLVVKRFVARDGATSVDAVACRLGSTSGATRRLLELRQDITWLDDTHDWLVVPVAKTRVTTSLRKMLSVTPRLTLEEVGDGLARQRSNVRLPYAILRSLCATIRWLTLDDSDVVSPVRALDRAQTLSPLERLLVDVFNAHGRELPLARISGCATAAGMKRATVGVYLSRSPIFSAVSRGRYALRGAPA